MKASRLLKSHRRAKRLLERAAEASAEREVQHGLRELGRMRRRGGLSEEAFLARRSELLQPVVERPVLD